MNLGKGIQRAVPVVVVVALLAAWGCGGGTDRGEENGAPRPPEPSYAYQDPALPGRLDGTLRDWARDFGLYGTAAAVYTPGWFDWSGATGVVDRDLALFESAMLGGRLLSEEAPAAATDWMEIRPGGAEYGMGLFRSRFEEGFTAVGHTGAMPGGGAVMQYLPELDVYIGAVTNTDLTGEAASELVKRVRGALLGGEPIGPGSREALATDGGA